MTPIDSPRPGNVDQLRARIDSGLTGDKVPFPDPAAAPLGTDDEAAGHPPTREEIQLDALGQSGSPTSNSWPKDRIAMLAYCLAVVAIGAAMIVIALLA